MKTILGVIICPWCCNAPLKAREKIDKKSREKLGNIFIII